MSQPRIAVLIDLPREAASGGHVKYWERMAQAAARLSLPVDLTFYFSGSGADEILSPSVRLRFLPPVFSTARLGFLPYVPAHTDLAPFHPAKELGSYDVLHTTDGFFAFARTAEKIAATRALPLISSFHTDTPAYAEVFTRQTLESLLGSKLGGWLDSHFHLSRAERLKKEKRLATHLKKCAAVLAMRREDIALTQTLIAPEKIKPMRLGVDKDLFAPDAQARALCAQDYRLDPEKFWVLFVGRVDAGKNMPLLSQACAAARDNGAPLHLIVAGTGPMQAEVQKQLGANVTFAGLVPPEKLAKLYAAVDCLAIASDIEIGGMIGLEALACGCPVLVSRISGVAQIAGDPPVMQKVESNAHAWQETLSSLAQDKTRQKTLRQAALDYRQNNLASWEDVVTQDFLPVWNSLLQEKK